VTAKELRVKQNGTYVSSSKRTAYLPVVVALSLILDKLNGYNEVYKLSQIWFTNHLILERPKSLECVFFNIIFY